MNIDYKIKSEISEDQIETDVASYLGYITPFWSERFRFTTVDEQLTGSDKLFDRFVPIYLQFKVSEGLRPLAINFNLLSPNKPLQGIRRFRRQNTLANNSTLYFRLRDQAATALDFQHNILRRFHQPPWQYALYIAPLSLTTAEYDQSLRMSLFERLFTLHPFIFRSVEVMTNILRQSLGVNPFLRGHISISPHIDVTTSEHYYSFSKSGSDLAWHSEGETLKGDFRLSTQIKRIFQNTYDNKDVGFSKEQYLKFINDYFDSIRNVDELSRQQTIENRIIEFAYYFLPRRVSSRPM